MDPLVPEWRTFGADVAPSKPAPEPPLSLASRIGAHRLATVAAGAAIASAGLLGAAAIVLVLGSTPGTPDRSGAAGLAADGAFPMQAGLVLPGRVVDAASVASTPPAVIVDVEGAVRRPGLHRIAVGSRVGDAIAAAGGFSGRVDLRSSATDLNLAAPVADGDKVVVPELGAGPLDAGSLTAGTADLPTGSSLVDINRATEAELEALPAIGPVTAARIVEARTQNPFASVDDLRGRGLLGSAAFEQVKGLVTVGG
jgi:competence protein ComEA